MYRKWETDDTQTQLQLIVPSVKQAEIIKYYHDIPSAGHLGIDKTLERIKNKFYWPNMKESIEEYIKTCEDDLPERIPKIKELHLSDSI